jgi:hypothetical protein
MNEKVNDLLKCFREMVDAFEAFERAQRYYCKRKNEKECTYKNVKIEFLEEISKHYCPDDLLNCYGDIFYVEKDYGEYVIGKRVLWNFGLSEEKYIIYCREDVDGTDCYEIKIYEGD